MEHKYIDEKPRVKTSYNTFDKNEVEILLRDVTAEMVELDEYVRERLIQSGTHYSEMLPKENEPSKAYNELYEKMLKMHSAKVAQYIMILADKLFEKHGREMVLISLARAGLPIGVLLRKWLKVHYNIDAPHYSISIIRGKGIDKAAMEYIFDKEIVRCGVEHWQFVDGWTGKGMINSVLYEAAQDLAAEDDKWENLNTELAVIADPANVTELCGTHRDILIPSACLNSTVSGLISRTIQRPNDNPLEFHGAVYFEKFKDIDRTNEFIYEVSSYLNNINKAEAYKTKEEDDKHTAENTGMEVVKRLQEEYDIKDIGFIKPGIGETTRVLLRRIPDMIIISDSLKESEAEEVEHIIQLCKEKNVKFEYKDIGNYKACGIIKNMSADV